jgi:hypothetical protein
MSHVARVQTQYRDQAALVAALEAQFSKGSVEVHALPVAVAGWMGQKNDSVGHVVVRQYKEGRLGHLHADLGFLRGASGEYTAIVDDYDVASLAPLKQRYAVSLATSKAKAQGYTVKQEAGADGRVKLTLSKWS